jgi:antirestriction protein ArdC
MSAKSDLVVKPILEAIKAGTPPWKKGWVSKGGMPMNHLSDYKYGIGNAVSCWVHNEKYGYTSNRYISVSKAIKLGFKFKGEKGDPVRKSFPIYFYSKIEKDEKGEVTKHPFMIVTNTANIEQFEGIEDVKEPVFVHDGADLTPATELQVALGVNMGEGEPSYSPLLDRVKMPDLCQFKTVKGYLSTMFHELAHSTGHESRLNRDMTGRFGTPEYAFEELIAELSAVFLCAEHGIDYDIEHHASYLGHWAELLEDDSNKFIKASTAANKVLEYCKQAVSNQQKQVA